MLPQTPRHFKGDTVVYTHSIVQVAFPTLPSVERQVSIGFLAAASGVWPSSLRHLLWEQRIVGANPTTPMAAAKKRGSYRPTTPIAKKT